MLFTCHCYFLMLITAMDQIPLCVVNAAACRLQFPSALRNFYSFFLTHCFFFFLHQTTSLFRFTPIVVFSATAGFSLCFFDKKLWKITPPCYLRSTKWRLHLRAQTIPVFARQTIFLFQWKKEENYCAAFLFHSFNRAPEKIRVATFVPIQKPVVIQVFCNV